jgi:hypothetical protein
MKKFVFYPLLFSVDQILLLFAANLADIPISQIFPVIMILPMVTGILVWLLYEWLKDFHRAGFIIFLTILWFFHYGTVHILASQFLSGKISLEFHWILFPLWTLLFVLLSSDLLWRRVTHPEVITLYMNLTCISIFVVTVFRLTYDLAPRHLNLPKISPSKQSIREPMNSITLPDVYYIILDGYARDDVLRELYNYDNSWFLDSLVDKGFFIASQSQSNYTQTALSIGSSLNMDYLSGLAVNFHSRGQLIWFIQHSQVRSMFKQLDYDIVAFSTGYQMTDLTNADQHFSSPRIGKSHDLEALVLINSVAVILIEEGWFDLPISRYKTAQERIDYTFTTLANEVPLISKPKLIFAHIIVPHPPFIFDQTGPVTPEKIFFLIDGFVLLGGREMYKQGYIDQLTYVNKRLLQVVDGILENSKTPPIIIFQADHGPGAYLDRNSIVNTCLKERFSILNALYLPQGGDKQIQNDISPVNTFSFILNTYFGTDIKLLENKEYFSSWDDPFVFTDVSEKSQLTCDMR